MEGDEARLLLGFAPNSRPTPSEVKAAYKKKIWESHPDLFPAHEKPHAESRFKLISEAYTRLLSAAGVDEKALSCLGQQEWSLSYEASEKRILWMSGSLENDIEFIGIGMTISPRERE